KIRPAGSRKATQAALFELKLSAEIPVTCSSRPCSSHCFVSMRQATMRLLNRRPSNQPRFSQPGSAGTTVEVNCGASMSSRPFGQKLGDGLFNQGLDGDTRERRASLKLAINGGGDARAHLLAPPFSALVSILVRGLRSTSKVSGLRVAAIGYLLQV